MSKPSATASQVDPLVRLLRNEFRLKRDCDYSIAAKHGHYRLICADCFWETIRVAAKECGVVFKTVHLWHGGE